MRRKRAEKWPPERRRRINHGHVSRMHQSDGANAGLCFSLSRQHRLIQTSFSAGQATVRGYKICQCRPKHQPTALEVYHPGEADSEKTQHRRFNIYSNMADLKDARPQRSYTGDFSEVGSERAETETLNEEELPSYPHEQSGPSTATAPQFPPTEKSGGAIGPTTSAPFNFPTTDLPSYETAVDFQKPLAIPQTSPTPDAPFIPAYPTDLLTYGIPTESWHSFVDTVSAFLSAKVSQQAVHHATDVAKSIQDYHKQYVTQVKRSFRGMGKSAKQFNPFGVVGGALGLTFGTVGHAVGSIFNAPLSLIQKPRTPRERATVYVTTANKDWFHRRGLHALLLDTTELSTVLGISQQEFLAPVRGQGSSDASEQLASLQKWIGDVQVRKGRDADEQSTTSSQAQASSSGLTPTSSRLSKGKSVVTGKQPWTPQLQLGAQTLWLVVTQEKNVQTIAVDEKGQTVGNA